LRHASIVLDNIIGNGQSGFTTCLGRENSLCTIMSFTVADHQALNLCFLITIYEQNPVNEMREFGANKQRHHNELVRTVRES